MQTPKRVGGGNDGKPKGHGSPVRLKKHFEELSRTWYVRTAGERPPLLWLCEKGRGCVQECCRKQTRQQLTQRD